MVRVTNRQETRDCAGCDTTSSDQARVTIGADAFSLCPSCQRRLRWWLKKAEAQRRKGS